MAQLGPGTTVVRFDVPGAGASPDSPFPYRFPYLATVLGRLLKNAGVIDRRTGRSQVDVLGLSWGGGLAQQFAFQNPRRCRRLIPVSTGTGSLMIPAKPLSPGNKAEWVGVRRQQVLRFLCRADDGGRRRYT